MKLFLKWDLLEKVVKNTSPEKFNKNYLINLIIFEVIANRIVKVYKFLLHIFTMFSPKAIL